MPTLMRNLPAAVANALSVETTLAAVDRPPAR
jgi:hypothetical protein